MSIAAAPASEHAGESGIACPYCAASMPTSTFASWPKEPRLATAECAGCARTITVPAQWVREPVPSESSSAG